MDYSNTLKDRDRTPENALDQIAENVDIAEMVTANRIQNTALYQKGYYLGINGNTNPTEHCFFEYYQGWCDGYKQFLEERDRKAKEQAIKDEFGDDVNF